MADTAVDNVEVVGKVIEKEVVDSPKKGEEITTEEKENGKAENGKAKNGDACEKENGSGDKHEADEQDSVVCPVKRKSGAGDAPEGTPAEGASPEKKAKLDDAPAEAESNGEAEVAA